MITLKNLSGKTVAVIGFGKTGKATAKSLLASSAKVIVHDDLKISSEYQIENLSDESTFKKYEFDYVVVSPGIHMLWPLPHPVVSFAKKYGVPIENEIDLFQKNVNKKIISVTGTNGKSTTTALINHILNVCGKKSTIGGNFGLPALSLPNNKDFYVLELSSYQLESCNICGFDSAILLNITPDHLKRHGGMHGYIEAKQKVFANFKNDSIAIVGVDDNYSAEIFAYMKSINHKNVVPISGSHVPDFGIGWSGNNLIDNRTNKIICDFVPESLQGNHNKQNIAAAYAACKNCGISNAEFRNAINSFQGLSHRQEFVTEINGVKYVNDSKATNIESTKQALMRYENVIWILGGRPKDESIDLLKDYFRKIKSAFLIGEIANEWCEILKKYNVAAEVSGDLEIAVAASNKVAANGDIILLSPACASFDQFKSFEDRGDQFKKIVARLTK